MVPPVSVATSSQQKTERTGAGPSGTSRSARDDGAAPAARGGAGAGASAAGLSAGAGGGVKQGALGLQSRAAGTQAASDAQNYAAEYRAAWTRAQTLIAGDKIPPDLREYLRRYFAAIRSPRRP